ncbi:flavodoxin-dependent (E)-4-hydroxy-3-methylbut-2-enyl-diphosphate synthase [Desulfotalea psychrophila]|uniref:4-hydroxy-3-methylbut-2-en-1-yl diphosphate synthase (flavodoxin) n=1 Tax=Desulfotalea psychrophila (strain LSv54 / DSM 12343) TaxID=177439 RepID=ISPG_DESPS|nr:flavodoxin-dependent (E)-4-hydroxy-3-methylbut-2-enyl-diphosphate synthase [Desulfotalea psychrophila]Q6AP32.1 RecName: Full=4-hydroxy-3-methylbut-2-en-1-yl diphosphate synthase (flavodoxin); AltName: Full=1-hydroxy-2-methyl-2-(E)-butenyl 4-diphosphate synthase [Desulfotalea psychrophila LSv54]CAG35892.1 probable peptidoglycan acetylation protein (GcpE) [Desulfotalea psychrophila LSv54]
MISRRSTRQIQVGRVAVGGDSPVSVQSMTNTDTRDIEKTAEQLQRLQQAGCDIARVAVLDQDAARAISALVDMSSMPIIADIHFDYRLAIAAMENGAAAIRINPGNLGGEEKTAKVVAAAKMHGLPIRVGVNSGSIEKDLLKKYGYPTADNTQALIESALRNVRLLEKHGFEQIKISIKSSDVLTTVNGYQQLSKVTDYPLHLGVTEAGGLIAGTVKSSVALGILLNQGIGDTLRISLTRDPVEEVRVAFELLRCLGIRQRGPELISCPTCGRTRIDLFSLAEKVEQVVQAMEAPIKVAVMGCVVNGPGEAKEADIGIAGGEGLGIIFKKGVLYKKVAEEQLLEVFLAELRELEEEYQKKHNNV